MEILFTFLAERYERRSVVITSNLAFSEWNQIFKDPPTTAAAIDCVVHHSVIIEFGREMKSVRAEEAAHRNGIRLGDSSAAQDAESWLLGMGISSCRLTTLGLPIGSGLIESACKWLIQQRFKGIGMRWSEDGFNHVLHLRLDWVNRRFGDLFVLAASPCC